MVSFNEDALDGVRWALYEPIESATIIDDPTDARSTKRPLFPPQPQDPPHPVLAQPITVPPLSRMRVVLDYIEIWDYWDDAEAWDDKPEPLLIENPDGAPITVEQFIRALHAYAEQQHIRDLILEEFARGCLISGDLRVLVQSVRKVGDHNLEDENLAENDSRAAPKFSVSISFVGSNELDSYWEEQAAFVRRKRGIDVPPHRPPLDVLRDYMKIAEAIQAQRSNHMTLEEMCRKMGP